VYGTDRAPCWRCSREGVVEGDLEAAVGAYRLDGLKRLLYETCDEFDEIDPAQDAAAWHGAFVLEAVDPGLFREVLDRFGGGGADLVPMLAEEWRIADDGKCPAGHVVGWCVRHFPDAVQDPGRPGRFSMCGASGELVDVPGGGFQLSWPPGGLPADKVMGAAEAVDVVRRVLNEASVAASWAARP